MKNILDVQDEITELEKLSTEKDEKIKKKAQKRVVFLRLCLRYLESNPNEVFVRKTIGELKNRLVAIGQGYDDWIKAGCGMGLSKPLQVYRIENGVKKIKDQIATLSFLLK